MNDEFEISAKFHPSKNTDTFHYHWRIRDPIWKIKNLRVNLKSQRAWTTQQVEQKSASWEIKNRSFISQLADFAKILLMFQNQ